ncbi:uncharacterized protein LOC133728737 [Rosa rugosa]|uniref:uncharacterized protein LOC133728737 n=1 Tax=Rosa rugosa TaxID=74645 RepID=UPI002B40418F|nr:uncharacterized protein LOC133728737 [Rosa rugosa]
MKAFLERYHKRKATEQLTPPEAPQIRNTSNDGTSEHHSEELNLTNQLAPPQSHRTNNASEDIGTSKYSVNEINIEDLPGDPGLRTPILEYHPNVRDRVRRHYLLQGPCQPKNYNFPQTEFSGVKRRFNVNWFKDHPSWLEYSIEKDAAYCLHCYLFKPNIGDQAGGDVFVGTGFNNWKKKDKLQDHVGGINSAHNNARRMCEVLLNQRQHFDTVLVNQTQQDRINYRTRLNASVDCARFLLRQGLPFRGHDESDYSNNQGNFRELLKWHSDKVDDIKKVVLKNAPRNHQLTSPDIQHDIVKAAATETLNVIISDIGDALFSILVDESRDVSGKEQMAIVLRYVSKGQVIERFVGVKHVTDTTSASLKTAIDQFFSENGLSISSLRGQGYDGASNMRGEFNGLKALILKENGSAFYVHCFAHQLQLAIVAVAKNHILISNLFMFVGNLVNVAGSSCKRRDSLREKQVAKIIEELNIGSILSGRGLDQETTLKRAGDTRWSSHYGTLISIINLFPSLVELLEEIKEDGSSTDQKQDASRLLDSLESFDFVFSLHLMKVLLGTTNQLSQALQRRDQDIVNAMNLVKVCKEQLQNMRDNGWDSLLSQVVSFCEKQEIDVPNMDDVPFIPGKSRRRAPKVTNLHRYRVELFCAVIDMQLQELNDHFTETTTELLLCMACLNPSNSFSAFSKEKLIRLAQFYPKDFSAVSLLALEDELDTYISDMRSSSVFTQLKGISDLGEKMVETQKDKVYPLVYLLITLTLILPVATATVERAFSAMKIIKSDLRNRMGDMWMNSSMITYIEKEIFDGIDNETIMKRFQNMSNRRGQL